MSFLTEHRARFGVEPICRALAIAPSTYYAVAPEGHIRPTGREPMPQVLISCPITGELIPTGVHVVSLEDVERQGNLLIACPECGRDHEWKREDAVLAAS